MNTVEFDCYIDSLTQQEYEREFANEITDEELASFYADMPVHPQPTEEEMDAMAELYSIPFDDSPF